jgi:hypothetical protein
MKLPYRHQDEVIKNEIFICPLQMPTPSFATSMYVARNKSLFPFKLRPGREEVAVKKCSFFNFRNYPYKNGDTRWWSWLGHCTTNHKVVGSIPDGIAGKFHLLNPSSRTMDLRSTQPLTEMSSRGLPWGVKAGRYVGLTTLPPSGADCLEILVASKSWSL